jgi:hypothetical protein
MSSTFSDVRWVSQAPASNVLPETDEALLEAAGPVAGEHVLVIGHDAPGIVAVLACRGAAEITLLGPTARPETESVDVAVVTGVASLRYAQRAVELARQAMTRTGRIVLRSATEPDDGLADGVARLLRDAGFCDMRLRTAGDRIIAVATLPMFGGQPRA